MGAGIVSFGRSVVHVSMFGEAYPAKIVCEYVVSVLETNARVGGKVQCNRPRPSLLRFFSCQLFWFQAHPLGNHQPNRTQARGQFAL